MGNRPSTDEECDALIPKGVCAECDATARQRLKAVSFFPGFVDCFVVGIASDHEVCIRLLTASTPLCEEDLEGAGIPGCDGEKLLEDLVSAIFKAGTPTAFRLLCCTPEGEVNRQLVRYDPFAAAVSYGNTRLVEYLLDHHGYDPNVLFKAPELAAIPKSVVKPFCHSPLHMSCFARDPLLDAKILLNRGASPTRQCDCCPEAVSPIMLSAREGSLELLQLFLSNDRNDVNAVTLPRGKTALSCALMRDSQHFYMNAGVIRTLLTVGARPTVDVSEEPNGSTGADGVVRITRVSCVHRFLHNPLDNEKFIGLMLAGHESVPHVV